MLRTPFSCPGAPYEAAFLADSILRSRQKRDGAEIALTRRSRGLYHLPALVMGEGVLAMFKERNIEFIRNRKPGG